MTEREKMLAGELYDCGDTELLTQWHKIWRETIIKQTLLMLKKKKEY